MIRTMPLLLKYRHSTGWEGLPEIKTYPNKPKRPPTPDALRYKDRLMPTSLENARRRAMILIHSSEKDVQNFRDKHLRNARNTFGIETDALVRYVYEKSGKSAQAENYKEFDCMLGRCRTTAALVQKDELDNMDIVLKRAYAFELLVEKCQANLEQALNDYVDKFCLSFASETGNHEIQCVQEYENNIVNWRQKARNTLTELNEILNRYTINCGDSFTDFKKNYDNILFCMRTALKMFPRIADALKNWITADEAYPRKLHDQINILTAEKLKNIKEGRENLLRGGYVELKQRRSDFNIRKVSERLDQTVERKRHFRKKEIALSEKQHKLEDTIDDKQKEIENLYEEHYFKHSDSPTAYKNSLSNITALQEKLFKLQKNLEKVKNNLSQSKADRKAIEKEVYKLQKQRENMIKDEKNISKEYVAREKQLRSNHQENRGLRSKIECLRRIRTIKLHPDTLKKIYFEDFSHGQKVDITDGFGDACKIAASHIGYKWPLLYLDLPFHPKRDSHLRNQDIEALDIGGQRRDLSSKDVALRCLAKWKRLSSKASIHNLVSSLRNIGAGKIANKIEKNRLSVE